MSYYVVAIWYKLREIIVRQKKKKIKPHMHREDSLHVANQLHYFILLK